MINLSTINAHLENDDQILVACNTCGHGGTVDLVKLKEVYDPDATILAPDFKRLLSCPRCKAANRYAKNLRFTLCSGVTNRMSPGYR